MPFNTEPLYPVQNWDCMDLACCVCHSTQSLCPKPNTWLLALSMRNSTHFDLVEQVGVQSVVPGSEHRSPGWPGQLCSACSSSQVCWCWWCRASCPRMSVDILGTNCDQCLSMVQCCFTSRLIRTESPGRPPRLSHSSWTLEGLHFQAQISLAWTGPVLLILKIVWLFLVCMALDPGVKRAFNTATPLRRDQFRPCCGLMDNEMFPFSQSCQQIYSNSLENKGAFSLCCCFCFSS